MTLDGSDKSDIRTPRQDRSRARVEAILQATKSLIAEKGCPGLKIQDIAQRADVTAGSIYQYFPNKSAIIHALAKHYMDQIHDMISADLSVSPQSLDDCVDVLQLMLDRFYALYRDDPVMRDIWLSMAADKNFQDIDIEDSKENAALLCDHFKDLFPERCWAELEQLLFLAIHLSGATVHLALRVSNDEGDKLIGLAKKMVSTALLQQLGQK